MAQTIHPVIRAVRILALGPAGLECLCIPFLAARTRNHLALNNLELLIHPRLHLKNETPQHALEA